MKIYYYDSEGKYTGSGSSHSVVENSTEIAPENLTDIFIEGEWIAYIEPSKTLHELKALKLSTINNLCELSIVGGFKSSALGEEYFYYSTLEEQTTLNSLINLGFDSNFKAQKISFVDGVEIKGERKQYPQTLAQLRQILIDGAIHIKTQIDIKDSLETQIKNATTVQELDGIIW